VLERLVNRAVLTMLSLGVGLLAVLMLGTEAGPVLAGSEVRLLEVLGWLGLFGASVLLLRVLLDVLRSEAARPSDGRQSAGRPPRPSRRGTGASPRRPPPRGRVPR
jgi:hypothetical protein